MTDTMLYSSWIMIHFCLYIKQKTLRFLSAIMGNYLDRVVRRLEECHTMLQCRKYPEWKTMIRMIKTPENYDEAVKELFADGIVNEDRMMILKCFTRDLCSYHQTDLFRDKYLEVEKKLTDRIEN